MKTLYLSLVFAGLCGMANAAVTIGAVNFTGSPTAGTGTPLVVSDNGPGLNTALAFGSFMTTLPDFASADASSIIAAFTQNGGNKAFTAPGLINGGIGNAATSTDDSSPWIGKPVYILVGDAATLATSTEVIVFSTSVVWPKEIEGVGAVVPNIPIGPANLERGAIVTSNLPAPFTAFNKPGGAITFVPEPSAALLGLIGLLGFIRRRR